MRRSGSASSRSSPTSTPSSARPSPPASTARADRESATRRRASPALSQIDPAPRPIKGRKVGVIAHDGSDLTSIAKLRVSLERAGAKLLVIALVGGKLKQGRRCVVVDRTFATAQSIELDAIVVAGGTTPTNDIKAVGLLQEAFRHLKPLAAWGDGDAQLALVGISTGDPGVVPAEEYAKAFTDALITAVGRHRVWARADDVMSSPVPPAA